MTKQYKRIVSNTTLSISEMNKCIGLILEFENDYVSCQQKGAGFDTGWAWDNVKHTEPATEEEYTKFWTKYYGLPQTNKVEDIEKQLKSLSRSVLILGEQHKQRGDILKEMGETIKTLLKYSSVPVSEEPMDGDSFIEKYGRTEAEEYLDKLEKADIAALEDSSEFEDAVDKVIENQKVDEALSPFNGKETED